MMMAACDWNEGGDGIIHLHCSRREPHAKYLLIKSCFEFRFSVQQANFFDFLFAQSLKLVSFYNSRKF